MGSKAKLAALAACAVMAGCAAEVERTTASFALTRVASCPIEGLEGLELTVVGDFPSEQSGVQPAGEALALDALPIDARALSIDARLADGRAAALALLPPEQAQAPLVLMPLDASCPLGDTLVAAPSGAAVAATSSGGLLIVGGSAADGSSLRNAVVLPRGSALARQVEEGLLLRRAFASATTLADGVLVAGGGPDDEGPAHDTFEVYDQAGERFLPPQRLADGARRNHGAARLPDGRVLLVGGVREKDGAPLGSAELLAADTGAAQRLTGVLRTARADPAVLVLDDGRVLVLLGRRGDAQDAAIVIDVEQLDLARERFDRVAVLPEHPNAAVAPLEGSRVAYMGCAPEDQGGACELLLLVPGEGSELEAVSDVITPEALVAAGIESLTTLRLAPLRDGKLLLTARASEARAWLLDLARGEVSTDLDATRVPDQLVELADGTLAELDAFGASLRRHDARSAFHDPPAALLTPAALAVDRPTRASFGQDGVRAEDGPVRLDLPFLRFGRLRVELALEGQGRVLLEPEHAPPIAIELGAGRVALGECELTRADDVAEVVIERRGAMLTLRSGDARRTCGARALSDLIGLALGLDDGARLHRLRVERR